MTDCLVCCDLGYIKFADFNRPRLPFEFRQVCPAMCQASKQWHGVKFEEDYPGMCVFSPHAEHQGVQDD